LIVLGSFFVISIGDTPTRPTLIFQGVSVSPSLAQRGLKKLWSSIAKAVWLQHTSDFHNP
jgi:hypothetical protein